jgi:phage anti-repressor protein
MELICITTDAEGIQVVSARELYTFLQIQTDFTDWCKRMFENGFTENQDYNLLKIEEVRLEGNRQVKRFVIDYALTLDTAKEISMMQKNAKGKEARQYFISCERKLKQAQALILQQQTNEVTNLRNDVDNIMKFLNKEFPKVQECFEYVDGRIDDLEAKLTTENKTLENTVERVDKIEEKLDFKAVAYIYVMFCPRRKWYKIGSSHDAQSRKRALSVVDVSLDIILEIPMFSRDEGYTQENALKKRFITKHRQGEWYELDENDLAYLRSIAQSNTTHLMQMA